MIRALSTARGGACIAHRMGRRLTDYKGRSDRAGNLGRSADPSRTPTAEEARLYSELHAAGQSCARRSKHIQGLTRTWTSGRSANSLVAAVDCDKAAEGNVINQDYKYVDGTSFIAPIMSSIVACI
jgi:hypothetical protein